MHVHVTGGTGFIGRHVVDRLKADGHTVVAPGVDSARVDLHDRDAVRAWLDTGAVEGLIHAAWYGADDRLSAPENLDWVAITEDLLGAFVERGGSRILTLGTCFEYELGASPLIEGDTAVRPHTVYGRAKAAIADLVTAIDGDGVSAAHARVGYVYGPGEVPPRLVPALVAALAAGERFPTTSGTQRRDYTYVTDMASALAAVLASDLRGPVNVGSGTGIAVADLVEALASVLAATDLVDRGALEQRAGDPEEVVLAVDRLFGTGWRPSVSLEVGAQRTVQAIVHDL